MKVIYRGMMQEELTRMNGMEQSKLRDAIIRMLEWYVSEPHDLQGNKQQWDCILNVSQSYKRG